MSMGHSLLIVDDSTVIRQRIAQLCRSQRLPELDIVGSAANGLGALALARQHRPALVTMDLTMPLMDGEECIERLVKEIPEVRILVVSALSDKMTALRAIRKGAHGFIRKPFTDEQLIEALLELMN